MPLTLCSSCQGEITFIDDFLSCITTLQVGQTETRDRLARECKRFLDDTGLLNPAWFARDRDNVTGENYYLARLGQNPFRSSALNMAARKQGKLLYS